MERLGINRAFLLFLGKYLFMAFSSLAHFVQTLEQQGELIRIKEFVDPVLEIAEVTSRISKQPKGGKALLFENTGTSFPVLINAFGSDNRIALALGVHNLEDIGGRIHSLLNQLTSPKNSIWEKLSVLPTLGKVSKWMPVVVNGRGVCQEVVDMQPNFNLLPILKCWPFDGGRFITLPMVNTRDEESGVRNVGMYRMQVFEENLTGMHWHRHKVGARHFEQYKKKNKPMPVAVALGGDPAYTYAATAPMPDNMDEYLLAGFLRQKKVRLVKCLTVDIEVPEDVDFVIEGYVDPSDDLIWEGPFGDHTGFYSLADWYPKFHVTCITHRKNAIYPATLVGIPPMEDAYIAKATERIFLEPIRATMLPELDDMVLPVEGVAHNIALIKLKTIFPGQAYKAMNALWGAGQMMFNKFMVALPSWVNLNNNLQVLKCISDYVEPKQDFFFSKGPLDVLDHSSDTFAFGGKLFIDATRNVVSRKVEDIEVEKIVAFLNEYKDIKGFNLELISKHQIPIVVVSVSKFEGVVVKNVLMDLCLHQKMAQVRSIVAVDVDAILNDMNIIAWFTASNVDPNRDIWIVDSEMDDGKVAIDATRKAYASDNFLRQWPNVVVMDGQTISNVNSKWDKLGMGPFIESPSAKFQCLSMGKGAIAEGRE